VLGIGQLAKDVLTLLDHLQIPEAVLVGSSIGGYVALEIWRQAPERVRGLAFVCSKPHPDTETNQLRRATTIDRIRAGEIEEIFDEMAQSLIGPTARERRPEIVAELRARLTLTPETLIAVQAGLATRPDSRTTIRTITVPVLAVAGGEDPGVTPEEMQAFSYAPGGFEFHLLPDAGHMAAYEQPEKVASLLAEWLRQMDV